MLLSSLGTLVGEATCTGTRSVVGGRCLWLAVDESGLVVVEIGQVVVVQSEQELVGSG